MKRDLSTIFFFIGQVFNQIISMVLKKLINSPRPEGSPRSGSGMPSSHSQMIAFFSCYIILLLYTRLKFENNINKHLLSVCLIFSTIMVAFSRTYILYHTYEQIFVGIIIGVVFGSLWFIIQNYIISKFYSKIINLSICKYFYIKDTSHIDNILKFEYESIVNYNQNKKKN
eukprot:TRINITY_DN3308_c0_g1_i1.p1 TRINITY_DN3308_c0_g1~~TRINITY_DN3308_c0_g1_i1.p1  ORF type:complete len:171 (+),score=0.01 TRINITY_DN3308_c0_g1_i1:186-698(+)